MQVGSRTVILPMRWRRIRRHGGEVGMRRRHLGQMQWEKAAPKEKGKARKDVGIVETHRTSKETAQREKEKETGKEAEVKDIPKEVKGSKAAKVFQ